MYTTFFKKKIKFLNFSSYLCATKHGFIALMVKKELTEAEIAESIPDLWQPLTEAQRELLAQNFTIQKYKKNETIYCEGETPMHLMCLLSGKVKIYKDGVGGRSQIIRVIKNKEYFAYRAYLQKKTLSRQQQHSNLVRYALFPCRLSSSLSRKMQNWLCSLSVSSPSTWVSLMNVR